MLVSGLIKLGIRVADDSHLEEAIVLGKRLPQPKKRNHSINRIKNKKKGGAALNSSRELAYLSTISDVRELNCRVRNGSGWNLSAMAAESPKPSSRFERE